MTIPTPRIESTTLGGMVLAAAAFALLSGVDTIFKLVAMGHPPYQIIFINACFAMLPIVGWTMRSGGLRQLHTLRLSQHLLRGATSVMSAFAALYAYSRLPLTDFYAIIFAGPLLVTAMSAFWLGEVVERSKWLAIAVGFFGVVIITNPLEYRQDIADGHMLGRLAALIAVFCYSLSVIMIRRMRIGETNMSFAFYGYLSALLIGGGITLLAGAPSLRWMDVGLLMLSGTLAGMSGLCMMTAYHRTPVALVAPFQYTQIIWGAVAGYFIWAHVPELRLFVGALIVALSGFYIVYKEMRTN